MNRRLAKIIKQGYYPMETRPLNPKDIAAAKEGKPELALLPPAGSEALARAMMNGAKKYGAWNWRSKDKGILLSTYVSAAKRHLDAFMEGEDNAPDSGVHHLGHVMACCAIALDALKHGVAVDDRPPSLMGTEKEHG